MQHTHTAIHTFTYDERRNFTDSSDARYWSLAMIANHYWFQVDTYSPQAAGQNPFNTFICVDFEALLSLLPNTSPDLDIQIRMHDRSAKINRGGCSVETITRIFKLDDGSHLLLMESGQLRFVGGKHEGISACMAGETIFANN